MIKCDILFLFVNNIAEWRDTMNKDEFENKTLDENDFREVVAENNQVIDNNSKENDNKVIANDESPFSLLSTLLLSVELLSSFAITLLSFSFEL